MPTLFTALLAFSGLAVLPQLALAQTARLSLSRIDTAALPEVKVDLSFMAPDGSVVDGRTAADFKLSLDAAEQGPAIALTQFDKAHEPISLVTITQVSGALRGAVLTEVQSGFRRLGQTVTTNPASRVSVLSYGSTTKRLLEAGGAAEVDSAVAKLGGEAAGAGAKVQLLDALRTAIDLLKAQPAGQRKLIVVVSDGTDVSLDRHDFSELGNRAREAGIVIDTVGYDELDPTKLRNLQEISRRCAGSVRVAKSAAEVSTQLTAIGEEIKKQYVATFRLVINGDDKEHTFQVISDTGAKPVFSNVFNVKLPAGNPAAGKRPPPPVPRPRPLAPPAT